MTGLVAACSFAMEQSASETRTAPVPHASRAGSNETFQITPRNPGTGMTRLYQANCAKCHGQSGEGGGAGTRTLLTREKFDQALDRPFFDAIKNGVPEAGMEAYGESMSDSEIWGLVVHIRELQADALRREFGSVPVTNGVYSTRDHKYRIETVIDSGRGLSVPWALDWLPDGRMLVTNRPGHMLLYDKGQLTRIEGMPPVVDYGQGGLMEVAVHPQYAQNGWVYLAFNDPAQSGQARSGMTKIVRGKLRFAGDSVTWTDQQTIFETTQDNYNGSAVHFGSRIKFDGKGHIFFSIGERGNGDRAQDLARPNGKIFRVREDGTVPPDNPFVSEEDKAKGHLPQIWSYGHRNPQGLTFDLEGNLWDTEHGPRGGDELNLIKKGANYGWPVVAFSINYNDTPYRVPWPSEGQNFEMPVFRWLPSIGACGMDLARGDKFSKWSGDILAGGLSGVNVDRIRVKGGKLIEREEIFHGHGRVRDVSVGPDGLIYIALNGPDKVVRLVPAD